MIEMSPLAPQPPSLAHLEMQLKEAQRESARMQGEMETLRQERDRWQHQAAHLAATTLGVWRAFLSARAAGAHKDRALTQAREQDSAISQWLTHRGVRPVDKLTGLYALRRCGVAPGHMQGDGFSQWTRMSREEFAAACNVSADTAGKSLARLAEANLIRKKVETHIDPATQQRTADMYIAPPAPARWLETWEHPRDIPAQPKPARGPASPRKTKGPLCCPICGSTHCELHIVCANPSCGEDSDMTPFATELVTPTAIFTVGSADDRDRETARAEAAATTAPPATETSHPTTERNLALMPDNILPLFPPADTRTERREEPTVIFQLGSPEDNHTGNAGPEEPNAKNKLGSPDDREDSREESGARDGASDPLSSTPVSPEVAGVLAAACAVLAPVVAQAPFYVYMNPKRTERGDKYRRSLTGGCPNHIGPEQIRLHLAGVVTLGAPLLWHDAETGDPQTQALAWDSDGDFRTLLDAGMRLRSAGIRAFYSQNPQETTRGHLWVLLDRPLDPYRALAVCEYVAPHLKEIPERYPDPHKANGGQLRLPGGRYIAVGGERVPVRVGLARASGAPRLVDATCGEGWRIIAEAVTPASLLEATWLPPDVRAALRPKPKPPTLASAISPPHAERPGQGGESDFARFNRTHPIESMVQGLVTTGSRRYFLADWRGERTPSVHLWDDGSWKDFGGDGRHGRDAFDLWACRNGFWDTASNRPDRSAALKAARERGFL